jgi:signal transduction histidine kinase
MYFFQFLFLQKEYGYSFHKIEKIILFIYLIIWVSNFIPLVYLPFIEVRNKYLIVFLSIFHVVFISQILFCSIKTILNKNYHNYPYSIGFIFIFPFAMQDYLIPFNLKLFHEINSFYIVLLMFYSFNLIFKQHFIYKKIINMEKQYSDKLEKEVLDQTKELKETNNNLLQSNNRNNKLFSIISHDLRSPLNSLTKVLNLFQDKHLGLPPIFWTSITYPTNATGAYYFNFTLARLNFNTKTNSYPVRCNSGP